MPPEPTPFWQQHINTRAFPPTSAQFILLRAIGNDLPPRHVVGQSYANVKFILENEPDLPNLDKRWYLNRIVNKTEEERIVSLLDHHKQLYIVDHFNFTHYHRYVDYRLKSLFNEYDFLRSKYFYDKNVTKIYSKSEITRVRGWDIIFEPKTQYIIHNNQARNNMLAIGKQLNATYILPWDGNCYLNSVAWSNITTSILNLKKAPSDQVSQNYFYVPMSRLKNNQILISNNSFMPNASNDEPQLIFNKASSATFDETKPYGYRPKVDLLWRLKIPYFQFKHANGTISKDTMPWKHVKDIPGYDSVKPVGWTARLFSGNKLLEKSNVDAASFRGYSRSDGIESISSYATLLSIQKLQNYSRLSTTMMYNRHSIRQPPKSSSSSTPTVKRNAYDHVFRFINSPSSKHTNMSSLKLAKFLVAVGISLQGQSHSPSSEYRIQQSTISHAKSLVHSWFIDEKTALHPSSVNDAETLIHLCCALDGVKLLHLMSVVTSDEMEYVSRWAKSMTNRLTEFEYSIENNVGNLWKDIYFSKSRSAVLFEAGTSCIAAFAGDMVTVLRHTALSRLRLHETVYFNATRNSSKRVHNRVRDIVPWILLAAISEKVGIDVWRYGILLNDLSKSGKKNRKEKTKLILLENNIKSAVKQAELVQSDSETSVASWLKAIARMKYGSSFSGHDLDPEQALTRDSEVIANPKMCIVDDIIPPFMNFAFP